MTELELTKHFFDEKSEIWDSHDCMQKEKRLQNIFKNDLPELKSPLLDMGSGTGILIPILNKLLKHPDHIVEFDISSAMLEKAWQKNYHRNNCSFVQADGHVLPFSNETFANIICFAVYPHFINPLKAVQEMHRVLTKNGLLIILHLMGHRELNAMHRSAGKAVCDHALQAADIVSKQISEQSFNIIDCQEREDLYLIAARKLLDYESE